MPKSSLDLNSPLSQPKNLMETTVSVLDQFINPNETFSNKDIIETTTSILKQFNRDTSTIADEEVAAITSSNSATINRPHHRRCKTSDYFIMPADSIFADKEPAKKPASPNSSSPAPQDMKPLNIVKDLSTERSVSRIMRQSPTERSMQTPPKNNFFALSQTQPPSFSAPDDYDYVTLSGSDFEDGGYDMFLSTSDFAA